MEKTRKKCSPFFFLLNKLGNGERKCSLIKRALSGITTRGNANIDLKKSVLQCIFEKLGVNLNMDWMLGKMKSYCYEKKTMTINGGRFD